MLAPFSHPKYVVATYSVSMTVFKRDSLYTQQILLLSGIGDAEHLKSNDIPVVVNLPGVGQKLTDHPIIDMYYKTKSDARSIQFLRPKSLKDRFKFLLAVIQYMILGVGGPMAMNVRSFLSNHAFYPRLIKPLFFFFFNNNSVWRSCSFRALRRSSSVS